MNENSTNFTKVKKAVNINLSQFDAAIFDMDGTMINNMPYHKKAWKAFTAKHGLNLTDEEFKQKFSGKKNNQILSMVFGRELDAAEIARYTEEKEALYRELYASEITAVAGLYRVIEELRSNGKKLAIATTAPEKNRAFGLEHLRLTDAFELILGDEHVTHGKPNPEIYLETAKKLGVVPSRCLVFEDSPPGIESAKRAGMTVVGIMTTHTPEELRDVQYLVHDFSEIAFT